MVVLVGRLVGVYSTPHYIIEYVDGNRKQYLTLIFAAEAIGGELCITDETIAVGYFSQEQMKSMELMEPSYQRITDSLVGQEAAFVR